MKQVKLYREKDSGKQAMLIVGDSAVITCDGKPMDELESGVTDAAQEKHVPVIETEGNKVKVTVGSVLHPATPEHHIEYIYLQTNFGGHRKDIVVGEDPVAEFMLVEGETAIAAFEHCNLHGLWKKDN